MAAQIALSIVLLTGAGLLVRTVDRLLDEDGGFEPRQALTARLMLADRPLIEGDDHNAFVETLPRAGARSAGRAGSRGGQPAASRR